MKFDVENIVNNLKKEKEIIDNAEKLIMENTGNVLLLSLMYFHGMYHAYSDVEKNFNKPDYLKNLNKVKFIYKNIINRLMENPDIKGKHINLNGKII